MKAYTWEQLGRATLRRQFPRVRGRNGASVVELVRRVGPIQSQVARAPFVTVASRLPGSSYATINEAHERLQLVRGSSIRGTVHTSVREHHPLLDATTRCTMQRLWRRSLVLDDASVAAARAAIEAFATGSWRTPDDIRQHLRQWLADQQGDTSVEAMRTEVGRNLPHGHSVLIRRPVTGGWDRQTAPVYRSAAELLADDRASQVDDPDGSLVALTRVHLASYGPASRADIAWWSGEGLRRVDAALEALGGELTARPGPGGLTYYDLVDAPTGGLADPGVRLLPEFDALLVGYHPKARDRFVGAEHLPYYWTRENGSFSSVVLADGRLRASWRLVGTGATRRAEVRAFPGERRLTESELAEPLRAVETALDAEVTEVRIDSF